MSAQILLNIKITHCLVVSSCSNLWSYTLLVYCPLFTCSEASDIFLISFSSSIYNGIICKNIYDLVLQLLYEVKKQYNFYLDTGQLRPGGGEIRGKTTHVSDLKHGHIFHITSVITVLSVPHWFQVGPKIT